MTNSKDIYRKDLQLALSLIQNKNFGRAKVLIEKLIDKNPGKMQLKMFYGDCLIGLGKLELARKCFHDCLQAIELRNFCYNKIAWISFKLEEYSQALLYYKKALELNPKNASVLNSIGNIYRKTGSHSDAIHWYDQAILVEPKSIVARTNKGLIKYTEGKYSQSIELFDQVLKIDKNNVRALKVLADVYLKTGSLKEAFTTLQRAIILAPGEKGIALKIAEACKGLGKFKIAINFLEKLIKTNPDYTPAYISLSGVYRELKEFRLCIKTSEIAVKLDPKSEAAINNLGVAYTGNGNHHKAISLYKKAIKLHPKNYKILTNLGMSYAFTGQYTKAISILVQATKIEESYSEAHYGLGKVYLETGFYEKSIMSFKTAHNLNASNLEAARYMAHPLMYSYNFKCAWEQYEYRWIVTEGGVNKEKKWPLPKTKVWSGEKCKKLMLWREQGIGDDILALGLIKEAQDLAKKITIYSDKKLIPLCQRSFPNITFKEYVKPIKEENYNFHLPMGSLPSLFRQTEDDFKKAKKGYLKADPERVNAIRAELGLEGKKVIGISWKSFNGSNMENKNTSLNFFQKIFEGLDVTLVNLQYGDVDKEIKKFEEETGIKIVQCGSVDNQEDLDGLAALIEACDLVVSTSNVTIHLAGALGKDGFVLLSFIHGFWWLRDRNDSVWYPSLKIYRQKKFQDWNSVPGSLRSNLIKEFGLVDEYIS